MITYRVSRIVSPWMAAVGDPAGVPLSLVELSPDGGEMGPDGIADEINRQNAVMKLGAPAWVMLRGDEVQMDSDLLAYLKVKSQVRVVAEVSGMLPLGVLRSGGSDDRQPMFDHVTVVVKLPADPRSMRVQTFNSFILRGTVTPRVLADFSAELDRREYKGKRYVDVAVGAEEVVAQYGRGWRMTRAFTPER